MKMQHQPNIIWTGGGHEVYPKCVIGIDRDGVINYDTGDYVYTVDKFQPITGSLEAIAELRRRGHKIAIITNQGGIEKGIYTIEDVETVHKHMMELLGRAGCTSIDALYYSASGRKEDIYAKPNTGMFKRCEAEHKNIKFNQGYFVGDKMSDLKAADSICARPVLVRTGYGMETERDLQKFTYRKLKAKTLVYNDLMDFVNNLQSSD